MKKEVPWYILLFAIIATIYGVHFAGGYPWNDTFFAVGFLVAGFVAAKIDFT